MKPSLLLLCAGLLTGCAAPYTNVRSFPASGLEVRAFVVIEQEPQTPFGFVDRSGRLQLIATELNLLAQIFNVSVAPDGGFVAIESAGEGHPQLAIYRVSDLVRAGHGPSLPALAWLDPYPHVLDELRWVDAETLEFSAPLDFTRIDPDSRKAADPGENAPARTWRWNVRTDGFTALPANR